MRRNSRRIQRWGGVALIVLLGLAGAGCDEALPTAPQDPVQAELDVARAATARYQEVSVALQEGFLPDPVCVSSPLGTMGIHHANPSRMDGRVTAGEPEILLYLPEGGRMRLVAIEYSMPIVQDGQPYFGATPPANPGATPVLFGQPFDGPMAGHSPTQPWHYDLHVWIWAENPAGRFSQFNPQLRCP